MCGRQLVLVFAGGLLVPSIAHAGPPERVPVTARIYNTAQVAAGIRTAALTAAARALVASGIDVVWTDCDASDACGMVPTPGELVVRLVRSAGVERDSPASVLGQASIDTGEGSGVLATIFVNRVERMAALADVGVAVLLGRAIAHEVGHLLLATNSHSARGLMRARWSSSDLRRNDAADWMLTKEDAAAIRRRQQ